MGSSSFQLHYSVGFPDWLAEHHLSVGFSTYQAGKLFLIGLKGEGQVSAFERTFQHCMGLWSDGQTVWLASKFQLWRLENVLDSGQRQQGYDRLFVPMAGFTTSNVDAHDVAQLADGRPLFVATRFSCLATPGVRHSLEPYWQPPFVTKLAAEDRCHLNGLAMVGGSPRFATACSQTDQRHGWRGVRESGGCVIDVEANAVIAGGLSMPHSPRWDGERLWLLNSGYGELGQLDPRSGSYQPVAFCRGYPRGLALHDHFAVIGVSKPRRGSSFDGLPLDAALERHRATPRCGLEVVDLRTGKTVEWLQIEGRIVELYDAMVLPGVERPMALGFKTDEIQKNVWLPVDGRTVRWSAKRKRRKDA